MRDQKKSKKAERKMKRRKKGRKLNRKKKKYVTAGCYINYPLQLELSCLPSSPSPTMAHPLRATNYGPPAITALWD
jgi:hypothetical protein